MDKESLIQLIDDTSKKSRLFESRLNKVGENVYEYVLPAVDLPKTIFFINDEDVEVHKETYAGITYSTITYNEIINMFNLSK